MSNDAELNNYPNALRWLVTCQGVCATPQQRLVLTLLCSVADRSGRSMRMSGHELLRRTKCGPDELALALSQLGRSAALVATADGGWDLGVAATPGSTTVWPWESKSKEEVL